ncbi:MAG: cytosolic protein [Fibrobacteria bacterium]|nr:cytosolic protein [Fibrobacteria bacterium]
MECIKDKNITSCNCSSGSCSRKGKCCECLSYHLRKREAPACFFPDNAERTYDRSFAHFAKLVTSGKV